MKNRIQEYLDKHLEELVRDAVQLTEKQKAEDRTWQEHNEGQNVWTNGVMEDRND
jgi:hypothetical protein